MFCSVISTLTFNKCFKDQQPCEVRPLIDKVVRSTAFVLINPEIVFEAVEYTQVKYGNGADKIKIKQRRLLKTLFSTYFSSKMKVYRASGKLQAGETYTRMERSIKWVQHTLFTRALSVAGSISAGGEAWVRGTVYGTKLTLSYLRLRSYEKQTKMNDLTKFALAVEMSAALAINVLWNKKNYSNVSDGLEV